MKKTLSTIILILALLVPFCTFAAEPSVPLLTSVSFDNASIEGEFSQNVFEYNIIVGADMTTPTLASYEVSEGARAYVTYEKNEGINIDVKNDNLTSHYFFRYKYQNENKPVSSNSKLLSLECDLCEVYPAISDNRVKYDLYIPSDMTDVNVVAVPQDVTASCSAAGVTLAVGQTMKYEVTVKASDESTTVYTFNIKRRDKAMNEVKAEMQSPDFTSLVKGQLFYQKPAFQIAVASVVGGLLVIVVVFMVLRKLVVKVEDIDETEFFELIVVEEDTDEEESNQASEEE